jgi:hypothetical protein
MAKHATAEKAESTEMTTTGVTTTGVTTTETLAPSAISDQFATDAGQGLSTDQADNLVPLVYILQGLSPQVMKGNAARIEGAEAGDFWLRNASEPIVSGEQGLIFQHCFFDKDWVEWQPNRGGFVARHRNLPTEAVTEVDAKNPNKINFIMPSGNEVVETRYHVGLVWNSGTPTPYIIPLSSTGHAASRAWMFNMNSKQHNGKTVPSWACLYLIKTKSRTNAFGSWFTPEVFDYKGPGTALIAARAKLYVVDSMEAYDRGKDLNEAFATGAKVAEAPDSGAIEKDEVPY